MTIRLVKKAHVSNRVGGWFCFVDHNAVPIRKLVDCGAFLWRRRVLDRRKSPAFNASGVSVAHC